jgi:hypothetical protein
MVRQLGVENALLDQLPRVPSLRAWVAEHQALAVLVDELCKSFRRDAPGVRRDLAEAARGDALLTVTLAPPFVDDRPPEPAREEIVGRLLGGAFLSSKSELVKALTLSDLHLGFVDFGATDDQCLDAICGMAEPERRKAALWIREAARSLEKVVTSINAAVDFLEPANLQTLKRWGSRQHRPINAVGDGTVARIDRGGEVWFAKLKGLRRAAPIPSI